MGKAPFREVPTRPYLSFSLALLTTLACTPVPTQECVLCSQSAIVYGRVTASGGVPVARANVYVWISTFSCGSVVEGQTAVLSTTDQIGYYRAAPEGPAGTANVCVTLRVVAPPGSALRDTVLRGGFLDLGIPQDSLRVDVAMTTDIP